MRAWFIEAAADVNALYGKQFSWQRFPIAAYAEKQFLAVAERNGKICGFVAGSLNPSLFDQTKLRLRQDLLYVLPGERCCHALVQEFIDFGKANAHDIFMTIGTETNIKQRSLERLGFNAIEQTFRLEIK